MISINGFTDHQSREANKIGLCAFVSITIILVVMILCCIVLVSASSMNVMILAVVSVMLEVIVGLFMMIKAKKIDNLQNTGNTYPSTSVRNVLIVGSGLTIVAIGIQLGITAFLTI